MPESNFLSRNDMRRTDEIRRQRNKRPMAENRPSIGFALHNKFPNDEQPTVATFAQVMAHRIRSLLTGIEGYTDLLLKSIDDSEQRQLAFRVMESASRIEGILSDLQYYNDPIEANFHKVPAKQIPEDVLLALADSEIERVAVDRSINPTIFVRADEMLVRQALLSVFRNAFEAEPTDTSTITCTAHLSVDGAFVEYSIRNENTNLTSNDEPLVFQPFHTTKSNNLGLGLTLARRIAGIHKGELIVTSNESHDHTQFTLRLPVYRDGQ
jgi:signal transduction histidine kinase